MAIIGAMIYAFSMNLFKHVYELVEKEQNICILNSTRIEIHLHGCNSDHVLSSGKPNTYKKNKLYILINIIWHFPVLCYMDYILIKNFVGDRQASQLNS